MTAPPKQAFFPNYNTLLFLTPDYRYTACSTENGGYFLGVSCCIITFFIHFMWQ